VDGKSQGKLKMPVDLPSDVVGCIGMCQNQGGNISALLPVSFEAGKHGPGVTLLSGGRAATWAVGMSACNQIAVVSPDHSVVGAVQFSVKLSADVGSFIDIGWCSPSLDPTGKIWQPGGAPSHWMGEQGPGKDWIYRSSGDFKASTSATGGGGSGSKSWCLRDDDTFNRGTVRPWEPAVVAADCGRSGGGQVFFDTELGALRTPVDTTGMCFGVCA
jgi:hypothetical protein